MVGDRLHRLRGVDLGLEFSAANVFCNSIPYQENVMGQVFEYRIFLFTSIHKRRQDFRYASSLRIFLTLDRYP